MNIDGPLEYEASPWGNRFHFQRDEYGRVIDEVLGAGSSGPGKTTVLFRDPLFQMKNEADRQRPEMRGHPDYIKPGQSQGRALLLRRGTPMLRDLMSRGLPVFRAWNGGMDGWSQTDKTFTFRCGYKLTLGHCYEVDDVQNYVGVSWTHIGFDELIQFEEVQFETITSWARSDDHILAKDIRIRAATNPVFMKEKNEDFTVSNPYWVRDRFVEPWRDGNRVLLERKLLRDDNITYATGDLVEAKRDGEVRTLLEVDKGRGKCRVADGDTRLKPAVRGRWIYEAEITGKFYERTRMYMPATIADNPSATYREEQRRKLIHKPPHIRKSLLEGDWYYQPGGYFEETWMPHIHVVSGYKIPTEWPRWRSMDWGYKTPGVIHWYAMDPDGNIVIYYEYKFRGMKDEKVAEVGMEIEDNMGLVYRKRSLLTGPADTQLWEERGDTGMTKAERFLRKGMRWVAATKGRQANAEMVSARLSDHDEFGGNPGLTVFSRCTWTVRFAFSLPADPREPNVPKKGGNDHEYDSVSYGVRFAERGASGIPDHMTYRMSLERSSQTLHDMGIDGYGGR